MDGVLVDSENEWSKTNFLYKIFGKEICQKIGNTIGMTVTEEYEKAVNFGFTMNKDTFLHLYDEEASLVYAKANVTEGIAKLVDKLSFLNFKLGLVSSSRKFWIDQLLSRLSFKNSFDVIISVDQLGLKPKPHPEGYKRAMKNLGAKPETTVILEDSNSGIQAAKAAGAYTIGFRKNLVPGYKQKGADIYADSCNKVIQIIERLSLNS